MQHAAHHAPLKTDEFAHPRKNVAAFRVREGQSVADLGAGSGAYTFPIAEALGPTGRIYAIDVQKDLLRRISNEATRRGLKNVEVLWADLEVPRSSKLADGSMDLVLISNLLFQVPDKLPLLREARRIVKPGGIVVIIDWSDSFGPSGRFRASGMGPLREDVVNKESALKLAKEATLTLDREFTAGAHHYGLVLKPRPYSP